MLKKLLQFLPFVRHRLPWNMPLRKAITLSMIGPVKIKRIEKEIITQHRNQGDTISKEIEDAIVYLRRTIFQNGCCEFACRKRPGTWQH